MKNRDAVEATVWDAYSITYADDRCDAKAIAVLEKTISALPAFATFAGKIAQMSSNIRARYEAHRALLMRRHCVNWQTWPELTMLLMFFASAWTLPITTVSVRKKRRS